MEGHWTLLTLQQKLLYLRKLNCFLAAVLKFNTNQLEESILIPFVAKNSEEWLSVKSYFINKAQEKEEAEMSKEDLDFWQNVLNVIEYAEKK